MALKSAVLICSLLTLSIINAVVAIEPSDGFFGAGAVVSSLMWLYFPFPGILWGLPFLGVGFLVDHFDNDWINGNNPKAKPPPCGAIVMGIAESRTPVWERRAKRTITETLNLYPVETLAPCPPDDKEKRQAGRTSKQGLVAYNPEKLRGRDMQRLRNTTIHFDAKDHAVLKGSDFEIEVDISWTKNDDHSGLIHSKHSFVVPGIDDLVECVILMLNETAVDQPTIDAFNTFVEATNRSHHRTDLVEAVKELRTILPQIAETEA